MTTLFFTVPGDPVPKGRPRFSKQGGFIRTYTPEKTEQYEALVRQTFRMTFPDMEPFAKDIPLSVDILACFAPPKSASKKAQKAMLDGTVKHTKKPDTDNIVKAILDALLGVAYIDDSSVTTIRAEKRYSEVPRVEIEIRTLN